MSIVLSGGCSPTQLHHIASAKATAGKKPHVLAVGSVPARAGPLPGLAGITKRRTSMLADPKQHGSGGPSTVFSLSNGLKNLQSPQRIKPPGHFKHRRFSLEIVDPGHLLYKEQGFWSQSSPDTVVLVFGTSGDQRRFAWIRWGHICTADVNVLRTPQQGAHLQAQPSQVVVSQQSTGCS